MIYITGPRGPRVSGAINTTSTSKNWSKGLSPFFLGPVELYDGYVSQNVENAWQHSKVHPCHVDKNQNPTQEYWNWAKAGWQDKKAHRYPMGKGAVPLYSLWDSEKLSYVEARKKIYIPLYSTAVRKTSAFRKLVDLALLDDLWLWDFDGWDYRAEGLDLELVPDFEKRKMGHAFVLAMILEGKCGFSKLI